MDYIDDREPILAGDAEKRLSNELKEDVNQPRRGYLTHAFGDECGPLKDGQPLWSSERFTFLNIAGFWMSNPEAFFEWRKLHQATIFPYAALAFETTAKDSLEREYSCSDYASYFRNGAAEIVLEPIYDRISVSGGVLTNARHAIALVRSSANSEINTVRRKVISGRWRVDRNGSPDLIEPEVQDKGWPFEDEILDTGEPITIHKWLEGNYRFNFGKDLIDVIKRAEYWDHFSEQALSGTLELRGKTQSAISETVPLPRDWFVTPVESGPEQGTILIGDTKIWNIELRINPILKPSYLELGELDETTKIQSSNRVMSPLDARELVDWASKVLADKKQPPSEQECIDWGKARRLSRESIRSLRKSMPSNLRRYRGDTSR